MPDLKQAIKKSLIFLLSISVLWFLWRSITGKDLYIAAKSTFEVFSIATLGITVAEAAHWYQTKRFI